MNEDAVGRLAALRGEQRSKTEQFLQELAVRIIPGRLVDPTSIISLDITETGIEWPYAYARLATGEIFYSWPSNPTQVRQYWMVRDKLPKTISMATFGVVSDVAFRYAYKDRMEPDNMVGWTVVEAGAYIGIKALRFAKKVGPVGKVFAVEIDAHNTELMKLNIEANKLHDIVVPVHAALDIKDGENQMLSDGYQKNSLVSIDSLKGRRTRTVRSLSMDTLIDQHEISGIDFMNVQVNGAEARLLEGMTRHYGKLRRFHIVSRYGVDGEPIRPAVLSWLRAHGFTIVAETERAIVGCSANVSYGASL